MSAKERDFAKTVWDTLSRADIQKFIFYKNGILPYLPWAVAWQILMHHFPLSNYEFGKIHYYSNQTCEVSVTVTCKNGTETLTRSMTQPVYDDHYNSIINPTSAQINIAKMRCLAKCIAMFGLGISLYASSESFSSRHEEAFTEQVQTFLDELSTLNTKNEVMTWFNNKRNTPDINKETLKCAINAREIKLSQLNKEAE
ncbi:hypothetical protein BGI15_03235 [Snodgrassella alvi]|uniref:Sak single strand annealing protein n=1 Tax=Snodgrassella alvi TaxID=1196083 RepID=UPI0009FCF826|nr:DUF1071 domain-containing protein [Snodgrassella alvi]ORF23838.1 hypothetical protein BGI07_10030 [Snodgrassella alvi]ORF29431.1 hypothetical protein BGI10_10800 [Snodgrassella alvi]ORF34945.1 hypothetical protein BGI11_03275 [Snodgrassella alvi]ORF38225.1 hypothetical protein BGI14_09915 [Snodgrassella alvi]ORF40787.1 hypothetical protein BGI13_01015 [Snodgrassella alvi]